VQAGYIWLAILGVMNSVISVYYYLRITVLMYMKPAEADLGPICFAPGLTATLLLTALGVMLIGVFPGFIYNLAVNSAKVFPGL
jgi:NADH-quinone oxidoreductase subunit N